MMWLQAAFSPTNRVFMSATQIAMYRKPLLLLALPLCISANAQVWGVTGAEWHWTIANLAVDGYVHRQYTGDTLVGGRIAQKIQEDGYFIDYLLNDTITIDRMQFTSIDNDDVLLWVNYNNVWQWDTLYRFGAAPGTIWRPAGVYGESSTCLVQLVDIGTTLLAGLSLKSIRSIKRLNSQTEARSRPTHSIGSVARSQPSA
jgi:hypothetical protein